MRRPHGYATVTDPDRPLLERDTTQCGHCGSVIFVKPHTASTIYLLLDRRTGQWTEEAGAMCGCCWRAVCLPCHGIGTCRPIERALEALEVVSHGG